LQSTDFTDRELEVFESIKHLSAALDSLISATLSSPPYKPYVKEQNLEKPGNGLSPASPIPHHHDNDSYEIDHRPDEFLYSRRSNTAHETTQDSLSAKYTYALPVRRLRLSREILADRTAFGPRTRNIE
jgi:hypothetical protein